MYTYGATLIVSKDDRYDDFSLLVLSKADLEAATGWTAEGWTTTEVRAGDEVSTVTHPEGNFKRAAFGQVVNYRWSDASSLGIRTIRWRLGTTETGSSGSPVFRGTGEHRRVVGVLVGGNSARLDEESPWGPSCDADLRVAFNRFDHIYDTIGPYLESERRLSTRLQDPALPLEGDDHSDRPERATLLPVGSSVAGRIERPGDVDYFRLGVSEWTAVADLHDGLT